MGSIFTIRVAGMVLGLATVAAGQDLLREAARLDGAGQCGAAEGIYRKLLAGGASSPAVLNNAGLHYLQCGQPGKAKEYFERLLRLQPEHANANLQLAQIAVGERRGADALAYLGKVKERSLGTGLLRAEALHWAGKTEEARALLGQLQGAAGGNATALLAIGAASGRLGIWPAAEEAFRAVVAGDPQHFEALLFYGKAAARGGHPDRAQRALEAGLRLRPGDADCLAELGLLHYGKRDFSRAVFLLAQAKQKAPGRADILLALARAADQAGYYGDAALAYDEYLQRHGGDDLLWRDRARVVALTGTREAEGVAELERYAAKHPEDALGLLYLAQFSWKNKPEEALVQLTAALRLKPSLAGAQLARGWLLLRQGRAQEALKDLQEADRGAPGNPQVLTNLGLAYLTLEQPAEAEKALRRALAAGPESVEARLHLGRALMALGREAEAAPVMAEYRKLRPLGVRGPRREPGMIAAATLSAQDLSAREIERLRRDVQAHPEQTALRAALASLLLTSGKREEARTEYRALLAGAVDAKTAAQAGSELLRAEEFGLAAEFLRRAGAGLDLAAAVLRTEGPAAALAVLQGITGGERPAERLLLEAEVLEAAGRKEEAGRLLEGEFLQRPLRAEDARRAVSLLLRHGREAEAERLVERALGKNPQAAEWQFLSAALLVLKGGAADWEAMHARWPEWDEPYLAQGLALEAAGRREDALRKLRAAALLGSNDPALQCAVARLSGAAACSCAPGLRAWLAGECR